MALAHAVADQTEAAYRRGDLFEKRRRLMDEWSAFCAAIPRTGAVLPCVGGNMGTPRTGKSRGRPRYNFSEIGSVTRLRVLTLS